MSAAAGQAGTTRLSAIDSLRGLVIVIMALDHCRDYFVDYGYNATDLSQASWLLFLTRWITHFCAPVFVLLAGTSAWLHQRSAALDRPALQRFLVSRGLWIVLLEVTWNNLVWRFDLDGLQLQVLWALGWSMVFLAALLWLPRAAIIAIGAVIVLGHNSLDGIRAEDLGSEWSPAAIAWYLLHELHFGRLASGFEIGILYPLVPWIGVMALGYGLGALFEAPAEVRRRTLNRIGLALVAGFLLLRLGNLYGEPQAWVEHPRGTLYTALGWLNLTKYPPSLQYLLMTLGPALLVLAWLDCRDARGPAANSGIGARIIAVLTTFGRVPMAFYLLHVLLIHSASVAARYLLFGPAAFSAGAADSGLPSTYVPSLLPVYCAWFAVVATLYPVCRRFADYKRRNRHRRWLSYF
ncbi:MAG: heparan-alpha-glucosaminide N-acetyltransferase domain-containing protein [Nevskia sp.]|nr:heparan-alpha-glucosaminide N-acetyltransferase domain-containing protein [Nevskia sp.]